jgi:hypothetical protein
MGGVKLRNKANFSVKNPMKGHQCPKKQTHFKPNQTQFKPNLKPTEPNKKPLFSEGHQSEAGLALPMASRVRVGQS